MTMKNRLETDWLRRWIPCTAMTLCLAAPFSVMAGDWPSWRGPDGDGVTEETNLPLEWSRERNVRWKTPLPERGNSTPIVYGDRVFVTQAISEENRRTLMCFNREDGSLLWQSGVVWDEPERTHPTNPYCSPSPVTDGERVIVWFGSPGVYCYDFDGNKLWSRDLGPVEHMWGAGSSPILHEDVVIINFGPGNQHFLIALDKHSGETVWKMDIPTGPLVEHPDDPDRPPAEKLRGSWCTPLVVRNNDRDELLVTIPERLIALDPLTGEELWFSWGLGDLAYSPPMLGEGLVVALGGFHGPGFALPHQGDGDLTDKKIWTIDRTRSYLGAGTIHDGRLYIHDLSGVLDCYDVQTGELLWRERLEGEGGSNESWASMVRSGDRIYLMNKSGNTFVIQSGPEFELLAVNSLGEETNSSVVPAGGDLYLRTFEHLWRIGED